MRYHPDRNSIRLAVLGILLSLGVVGAAPSQVTVFTSQTAFETSTGAQNLDFPTDAAAALPSKPFGFDDHSCIDADAGIPVPAVDPKAVVSAPFASNWICFLGPDWNAGLDNTNPTPASPTIIANGEDDYTIAFSPSVHAAGFELLTNFQAIETITLTFDGATPQTFLDGDLATSANGFEFVGFKSVKPVTSIAIDTTGGASQNEGIVAILTAEEYQVDIDIKPCSDPNAVNIGSSGVVPVAILGSDDFDVTTVDPSCVTVQGLEVKTVGKADRTLCSLEDVVGPGQSCGPDGYTDLVCKMQLAEGADLGEQTWTLFTNCDPAITGSDDVKLAP